MKTLRMGGRATPSGQHSGFGLIELMIAMVIGLLVMGGTLTLYLDLTRNNREMERGNQQIEAGGVAMQVLREDLIHAGFWNGYVPEFDDLMNKNVPADYPASLPEPCKAFASWTAGDIEGYLGVPVQLYSGVPAGCASQLPNKLANSDVLVVRYAQTCAAGSANCPLIGTQVYFQASRCETDAARYAITAGGGATVHERNCATPAEQRKWVNNIYYLANNNGVPTLMRSTFENGVQQVAVALVEGVEALRFQLAVDGLSDSGALVNYAQAVVWADELNKVSPTNRGDGQADSRCLSGTPCTLDDQVNTVMVRADLLVRALDESPGYSSDKTYFIGDPSEPAAELGPFTDSYRRHSYSTSMRLVNVSGRRETP